MQFYDHQQTNILHTCIYQNAMMVMPEKDSRILWGLVKANEVGT